MSVLTGKNFIVDPRVKGKVTIISAKAMDEKELYEVFLAVLGVHGFAAIPGDNVTKKMCIRDRPSRLRSLVVYSATGPPSP